MRSLTVLVLPCVLLTLAACGPGSGGGQLPSPDAGWVADGGYDFSALDGFLDDALQRGLVHGFALQVADGTGQVVFRKEGGVCASSLCPAGSPAFTTSLVTGVASSSKWVTSTVALAALEEEVARGTFPSLEAALDTPVMASLGCGPVPGPTANVTVRQLMSFTSGLVPERDCTSNRRTTLAACACDIVTASVQQLTTSVDPSTRLASHPPGVAYQYGSTHQVVLGAWLERLEGESFAALFERLVRAPLGVQMAYVSPVNLSGSLHTSVEDYARYVDALRSDATGQAPRRLLSAEAVAAQRANQLPPDVARLIIPREGQDYGLNTWRWCYRSFTEEEVLGDPALLETLVDRSCTAVFQSGHGGKGGYQPFVDAAGRYSAVFSMREPSPGAGDEYSAEEVALTTRVRLLTHLTMTR